MPEGGRDAGARGRLGGSGRTVAPRVAPGPCLRPADAREGRGHRARRNGPGGARGPARRRTPGGRPSPSSGWSRASTCPVRSCRESRSTGSRATGPCRPGGTTCSRCWPTSGATPRGGRRSARSRASTTTRRTSWRSRCCRTPSTSCSPGPSRIALPACSRRGSPGSSTGGRAGRCAETGPGTALRYEQEVTTPGRLMTAASAVARPVLVANHTWMMRGGRRGLLSRGRGPGGRTPR